MAIKNKYGFIGFLSLLGLLGLSNENEVFLSFFAFVLFFEYFFITPDELFVENMRKAATWAFLANMFISVAATLYFSYYNLSNQVLAGGCTLGFGVSIAVFSISTFLFELKEKRGAKE